MCKKFSAVCCALVIVTAVYSLDFDKAKTALNGGSFIPVLVDYGFTEQQINSWTVGKIYIPFYLQQIRSGTLTAEAATTMLKNTSGAIGEISINDMIKMEQFFKDMATAADQLRNEENAERTAAEKSRTEAYQRYEQEKRQAEEAARIREAEEAEIERQEYAKRQEQRRQEAERNQRSKEQYAKSLGCLDYIDEGLIVTQAQITSANFDLAKKALIIPESNDLNYTVSNIVGNYVIYTAVISFAAISCNELFISFSKKQFILSEVALSYNSLLIGRDSFPFSEKEKYSLFGIWHFKGSFSLFSRIPSQVQYNSRKRCETARESLFSLKIPLI